MTDSIVDLINFANNREDRTAILVVCDPDGKKITYRVTVQKGLPLPAKPTNSKNHDI